MIILTAYLTISLPAAALNAITTTGSDYQAWLPLLQSFMPMSHSTLTCITLFSSKSGWHEKVKLGEQIKWLFFALGNLLTIYPEYWMRDASLALLIWYADTVRLMFLQNIINSRSIAAGFVSFLHLSPKASFLAHRWTHTTLLLVWSLGSEIPCTWPWPCTLLKEQDQFLLV